MPWNPTSPNSLGMEWLPTPATVLGLASDTTAATVAFTATTTRSVTTFATWLLAYTPGRLMFELYTEADWLLAGSDAVSTNMSVPTAEVNAGPWTPAAPRFAFLQDDPAGVAGADGTYLQNGPPSATYFRSRFGNIVLASGRRPTQVRLASRIKFPWLSGAAMFEAQVRHFMDDPLGTQYTIGIAGTAQMPFANIPGVGGETLLSATVPLNPQTAGPWQQSEVAALASTWSAGTEMTSPSNMAALYSHRLYVDHVVERRLAWAHIGVSLYASSSGDNRQRVWPASINTPSGASSVTVTAGTRYVIVLRRVGAGSFGIPVLKPNPPHVGWAGYQEMLMATGLPNPIAGARALLGGTIPITTLPASAVADADMEPYYDVAGRIVAPGPGYGYSPQRQTFPGAAGSYSGLRAIVGGGPAGTWITAKVRRVSDSVQMGSTVTLTREQWDALPAVSSTAGAYLSQAGYATRPGKLWQAQMGTAAVLSAGVDYAVDFESSSADPAAHAADFAAAFPELRANNGWLVASLDGSTLDTGAGYGTSTYSAWDGTARVGADLPVVLQLQPTAPASALAVMTAPAISADDGTTWNDGTWEAAQITWSATALGSTFAYYEVQRYDYGDPVPTWRTIAQIKPEATAAFIDYEGRRGTAADYRVRVVRSDSAVSAWVTAGTVTPQARTCGFGFVVNGPGFTRAVYQDVEALRTYTFLDAEAVVYRQMYQGDYQVAFRPKERRGVRWTMQLLVYSGGPDVANNGGGLPQWDVLRAIAYQGAPYVAVIDNEGGRIFANIVVPEGREQVQGQVYYATVTATQVAETPFVYEGA